MTKLNKGKIRSTPDSQKQSMHKLYIFLKYFRSMKQKNSIWRVKFKYETPGEYERNYAQAIYIVVADSKDAAYQKAYHHFSGMPAFKDLNLSSESIDAIIFQMTGAKIKLPPLTLPEDQQFKISARITPAGTLEYIVE